MKPHGSSPPWFGRQEKESFNTPKELPNVSTLNVWLAKVAIALTEASICYDKAEVAWLMEATAPVAIFENLWGLGRASFSWSRFYVGHCATGFEQNG